jgi:hypothetical protein
MKYALEIKGSNLENGGGNSTTALSILSSRFKTDDMRLVDIDAPPLN